MKGRGGTNLFISVVVMIILTQKRSFTVIYIDDDPSLTSSVSRVFLILNPESVPA